MKGKSRKKTVTNEDLAKSIDDLARMTARGFGQVDKRFEQIDKRFEQEDERFRLIIDRFARMEDDMADVKRALGPLVQMMAMTDREINQMKLRLARVERKVGIK